MNPASAPACSRDGCSLKVADGLTTSSFIAFAIYVCIIQTEITFVKGFDKKIWSYSLSDSHKIRQVMKMKESKIQCFTDAVSCLPPRLQNAALNIPDWQKEACEELHLRAGHTISAVLDGCEQQIPGIRIGIEDLRETVSRAARYSVHSYGETLAQGYLPLSGGHRLGICGTAVVGRQMITGIRTISSLNLRIACQSLGSAAPVLRQVLTQGSVKNTLILSPPGFGKTTLLRDLIRQISGQGIRVAVADERGELAAMKDGIPQFEIGEQTDVMDGCPKAQGAMLLLKTMSPMVIALDEVTSPQDVEAIAYAGHCGVSVLATAHAADITDLYHRPLYQSLLALQVFEETVTIRKANGVRQYICQTVQKGRNFDA